MISETKIDDTFPESQFLIEGFSNPFREDIPCRCIKQTTLNNSFEGFFVELNLRSKKWLLGCSYNHHKENIASHYNTISLSRHELVL